VKLISPPFNSFSSKEKIKGVKDCKRGFSEQNKSPVCLLRVHLPGVQSAMTDSINNKQLFIDVQLSGESAIEVAF
jgi:hypothetical protein